MLCRTTTLEPLDFTSVLASNFCVMKFCHPRPADLSQRRGGICTQGCGGERLTSFGCSGID